MHTDGCLSCRVWVVQRAGAWIQDHPGPVSSSPLHLSDLHCKWVTDWNNAREGFNTVPGTEGLLTKWSLLLSS